MSLHFGKVERLLFGFLLVAGLLALAMVTGRMHGPRRGAPHGDHQAQSPDTAVTTLEEAADSSSASLGVPPDDY